MASQPSSGGFSLFPNPNYRHASPRPRTATPSNGGARATTPQSTAPPRDLWPESSPPRQHRTPERKPSARRGRQPQIQGIGISQGGASSTDPWIGSSAAAQVQRPAAVVEAPPRCDTAFSEAQTLVRSNSNRSCTSAGHKNGAQGPSSSGGEPQALRSIFPTYNHDLPPDRQEYFPTQASPTHIPMAVISRPLYSPEPEIHHTQQPQHPQLASPSPQLHAQQFHRPIQPDMHMPQQPAPAAVQASSPPPIPTPVARWPPRPAEPPSTPHVSSTEELRSLWKVVSGWKATASEGRLFCLKMTAERDTPIYTLSSTTQPFYNLRIDPTSASAYVTLSRHDPSKVYKAPAEPISTASDPGSPGGSMPPASVVGTGKDGKHWQSALTTTLEETSRRHAPNDGLVALLYPQAAARVALERPDDVATIMTAERECARLVWDDDTGNHYLVHPALAMPFCVTIDRNTAWSRTEYTLEHLESPQHIARLTRDGTGNGWLELDTGIASKVDSVYIVEVAVAALMLVAHGDTQFTRSEVFEAPPVHMIFAAPPPSCGSGSGEAGSGKKNKKRDRKSSRATAKKSGGGSSSSSSTPKTKLDQFELDIESQTSDLAKLDVVKDKDKKLPSLARLVIKLITVTFKCFIWVLTAMFKALTGCISMSARCLTSEKL
ncbi:hypothetical protein PspLS_04527 [Pyricularia sp. CBS 133598]|nr:hypothetical protein PspLS_04527 [Pyricularia sp. CBS 133598]